VFLAITVFVQRHQGMFVADRRTDGFALARTNIALLGNVRQKPFEISKQLQWIGIRKVCMGFPTTPAAQLDPIPSFGIENME